MSKIDLYTPPIIFFLSTTYIALRAMRFQHVSHAKFWLSRAHLCVLSAVENLTLARSSLMTPPTMPTVMQSGSSITLGRIGRSVSNARLAVRDWNNRRITRKLLRSLNSRELADIGLLRADIDELT
jgi:uncharacterized protein YjiS (DUF1127 family)